MNSVDDIRPYQERIYHSPKANRKTSATTYDFPEHPPKKDKKWSLGSLFRRKKKEESESTTDQEQDKKGFLTRRKKKPDKRKKGNKQKGTFDHIVVPNSATLRNNGYFYDETGILSDPTGGFASYQGRTTLSRTPQSTRKLPKSETARDISDRNVLDRPSLGSADSLLKKNRKDLAKLRAEARRETHYCESSSDEDSQRSASSSRLRSDENINRMRDGSMSRKSRGARTERYIRRLSKDEEGFANLRSSKSDIENGYRRLMLPEKKEKPRSPKMPRSTHFKLPSSIAVVSGLSTIPPSHTNCKRNSRDSVSSPNFMKPPINNSNITNQYGSLSSNDPKDNQPSYQRSISYDADIHRSASPEMQQAEIIHAQLPLGKPSHRYRNLSLVEQPRFFKQKQPPPPPPRDPWRIGTTQHLETGRPMSYCFERSQQKQVPLHEFNHRIEPKPHSFNWKPNFRSTSEDCLPAESSPIPFHPRPASATTDHPKQRVLRKTIGGTDASEHYQYLTDKNPRSRKPISIQPFGTNEDKNEIHRQNESKKAIDFWKKIDQDVSRMQEKTTISKNTSETPKTTDYRKQNDDQHEKKSVPTSPQMFRASTHVRTNIFVPNTFKGDDAKRTTSPFKPIDMGADECDGADVKSPLPVTKSVSIDSITNEIVNSQTNERKSANLEDALDELEAIYNSLRLGDEDLLERAEQREKSIAAKKLMDANLESYPGWGPIPRGAVSDSSFSYEPFEAVDSPKRKRFFKKTRIPDRKNDDMALRKMNKERSKTISDPKEALAKVSYLLASPCYGNEMDPAPSKTNAKEPDIILDDVVLRTFKHANNSLKVSDPQLPFGIPVMPVLPAPNSDYLHAMPENSTSYTSDNKKIPDVVKDDLAFRNLRKDANKEPVLPSFLHDDLINNNNNSGHNLKPTFGSMKKKRAMRSLSANIYNLMQGDPFYTDYSDEPKEFEKSNLSDIADAMEIARQILKEKEEKINATRRAFLSDTEAKYRKKDVSDHLTESKLNFLNSMKSKQEAAEVQQRVIVNVPKNDACIQSKPPRGMTPERKVSKEPSPIDLFKEDNYRSSLDDLLSAFAVEAQQASKRITGEMKPLDSDTNDKRKSNYDDNKLISPALVVEARKSSSPSVFEGRKSSSPPLDNEESKITSSTSPTKIDMFEGIAPPKEFSNEDGDTITVKAEVVPLAEAEEVDRIISDEEKLESVANIVLNCNNDVPLPSSAEELDSEHDYVNMGSDAEFDKAIPLIDDSTPRKCMSPFEEHKAELIAGFQELKNIESDDEKEPRAENPEDEAVAESGEGDEFHLLQLPPYQITGSCESSTDQEYATMSENTERAQRIARYKEARRRQLALQYGASQEGIGSPKRTTVTSPSGAEGPRPTRASMLRAAAVAAQDSPKEKLSSGTNFQDNESSVAVTKLEKDKSSKRKSYLNRSLTCEEVPPDDSTNDVKSTRRRRRFFPTDVLQQSSQSCSSPNDVTKSDTSLTAHNAMSLSPSPVTATGTTLRNTSPPRKSQLSIHMENARKSVTEKSRRPSRQSMSSPKDKMVTSTEANGNLSNKENRLYQTKKVPTTNETSTDKLHRNSSISKRIDALTTFTTDTLAKVERLAGRNKTEPPKSSAQKASTTHSDSSDREKPNFRHKSSSILKKKEDTTPIEVPTASVPVSILKRKVSQDESKISSSSTHTPPVTFSPNVVEPSTSQRKQGILKKRRSLDESQVLRHRSCSPDVANKIDSRSILKSHRRSSLEDITRIRSPDPQIQGILKRKSSKSEDDPENSLNSPQSILKRRSGASSAGSTSGTQHVSIATAVILAAAGGAEMVLDTNDHVKPILKKKSFDEQYYYESSTETLKPILKKKSSTDTDDSDDKPRPILKISRCSIENREFSESETSEYEVRPILKQNNSMEEVPRLRLSFRADEDESPESERRRHRRSQTICTDFNVSSVVKRSQDSDRDLHRARPISVADLVRNFEHTSVTSTGAIPKKSSLKRSNDRSRTQPVTFNEIEASLSFVQKPVLDDYTRSSLTSTLREQSLAQSLFDLSSSLEDDSRLNISTSSAIMDSGVGKMSSDSAFQSLGDGLELEEEASPPPSIKLSPAKVDPSKLQMKAIAEEAKKKLKGGVGGLRKSLLSPSNLDRGSRHSTQPVTYDEVREAAKLSSGTKIESDTEVSPSLSERKGILKSTLDHPSAFSSPVKKCTLKTSESTRTARNRSPRPILKVEPADEGISSNESSSDSEGGRKRYDDNVKSEFGPRNASAKSDRSSKLLSSDTHTSDESSGSREVQSIIGAEVKRRHRDKSHRDGLFKSKSYASVGNDADDLTEAAMRSTIGELRAKLKESGESEWKKRIPKLNNANDEISRLKDKNKYNETLNEKTILASKKDELDTAAAQWKARVEKNDAEQFSVAGKMEISEKITINIPKTESMKRTPQAKRFKGKESTKNDEAESPSPPSDTPANFTFKRSISVPGTGGNDESSDFKSVLRSSGRKVKVLKPDDDTFTSFFKKTEEMETVETLELTVNDLDAVTRDSHNLLVQRRTVRVQKRREASRNPVKALLSRPDIVDEYTEVPTGAAEREMKRLNVDKLSKSSSFAVEALAGLASKEDFTSVLLKKISSPTSSSLLPYKNLMLLHVKGRRHVQVRLVNPTIESINDGDNFILVTPNALYNYVGPFSNVIEQSRACDIVNHIQQTGDMGCKVDKVITINPKKGQFSTSQEKLWKLLEISYKDVEVTKPGHPDEDEIYESSMMGTNMIYTLENNELIPVEEYWGKIPKIEMLKPDKVLVFDFGSEMYVWSGITAKLEDKKQALKLAKELWAEGYNYTDCTVCPLNIAEMIGDRKKDEPSLKSEQRPEWALFAKLTQHRETILFREKFLDWPDYSRVIKVKENSKLENGASANLINPCDVKLMLDKKYSDPDFIVDNTHLGRGHCYFDEEDRRQHTITSLDVKIWRILEYTYEEVLNDAIGHFYDEESYVIRWQYRVTSTGRELSGKPSKHIQTGRDRCLYFCWLGSKASINEKGTAALLTCELDSENARQVRVTQGSEPTVFTRLFKGRMTTHIGKCDQTSSDRHKLFMSRGEIEEEVSLLEVPCSMRSLRSRGSFICIDSEDNKITVWHGCKAMGQTKDMTSDFATGIADGKVTHFGLIDGEYPTIEEITEGSESSEFLEALGEKRQLYNSLLSENIEYETTPKLFHFSSILGTFTATEVLCIHRSLYPTPYPFLQSDLYGASQPGLFMFDNGHELWLWQGWWPENEELELSEQTGTAVIRWQAERKAAMQTAIDYWKEHHREDTQVPAYAVWAGLEPLQFTSLFPIWEDRDDIAALNIKDGKKAGEIILIENELAQLTRTTYPLAQLLQRPLPEGVDPTHLEVYLSADEFTQLLSMTPLEFQKLPSWKQSAIKKEKGLF